MQPKFCVSCGRRVEEVMRRCPRCGQPHPAPVRASMIVHGFCALAVMVGVATAVSPPSKVHVARRPAVAVSPADLDLPDVDGFLSRPVSRGPDYVRRTCARAGARIEVTLARIPTLPGDLERWMTTSVASFPQAKLDLSPNEANGFYQCTPAPPLACDPLIQLRSGVHVEIRGGGTSSREDVDALARELPLAGFALAGGSR